VVFIFGNVIILIISLELQHCCGLIGDIFHCQLLVDVGGCSCLLSRLFLHVSIEGPLDILGKVSIFASILCLIVVNIEGFCHLLLGIEWVAIVQYIHKFVPNRKFLKSTLLRFQLNSNAQFRNEV